MTLPTQLTIVRLLLAFLIMALMVLPGWVAKAAALALFLIAGATDWLDGYLARRWKQTSAAGALLDPLADKVLVLGVFLACVWRHLVPLWMVLIIAMRELLITGVRTWGARRGVVLPAAKEGKQKTVSQMVAIIALLSMLTVKEWTARHGPAAPIMSALHWISQGALWVAVVLTVVSGVMFFWRHRVALRHTVTR